MRGENTLKWWLRIAIKIFKNYLNFLLAEADFYTVTAYEYNLKHHLNNDRRLNSQIWVSCCLFDIYFETSDRRQRLAYLPLRRLFQDAGPLAAVLQGVSSLLLSNGGREGHRIEPDWTAATTGLGSTRSHRAKNIFKERVSVECTWFFFLANSIQWTVRSMVLARWLTVTHVKFAADKKYKESLFLSFCSPLMSVSSFSELIENSPKFSNH